MKKLLSLILCLSILMGCGLVTVNAAEDNLVIDVANDLHYSYTSNNGFSKKLNADDPYAHISSSGQLYVESKAVISAFLAKAAADESEVVILPGDLTDGGRADEHLAFSAMLREFEKNSGKQVYVVPGNHDFSNKRTSVAQFKEYYSELGYNQAIAQDSLSASYVAELSDDYRLLAIDSTDHGVGGGCGLTKDRVQWIKQQAQQAQKDGKKMIAMLHHNLLTHLVLINIVNPGSVAVDELGLKEIFAQYGVKYIFTAHTHEHDIASYVGQNGETIYDAVTGSLSSYPLPYRTVTFGEKVKFETNHIEEIDLSLVKGLENINSEAQKLIKTNLQEYSRICVFEGVRNAANGYFVSPSRVKSLLNITAESDPDMSALIDKLVPAIKEAMNMPVYKKDETAGMSIERILEAYGVTIPDSRYYDMLDVAVTVYEAHVAGDENYPAYSKEVVLASKGIGAMLIHILKDVTAKEYTQAIEFVCKLLGVDVPVNLIGYAGDAIDRFEGIELVVSTAILPLILKVSVDDAPADCNVTLPGYAELIEAPEAEKTFWEKIQDFFIKIFEFVMSLFAFI